MNYPVWYLPETGGGLLIALIAILHVFVSHFAVGGGLYLIYAEKKGLRENSSAILEFTRKHARFFLLLTMVFGSITGVGIWFIIALVNPAATSFLIHNFVFGWAAEWVFFVVEIAAAFVYYYMFGRMDSSTHLKVGWLYFIAAWMSLFLINGIIGVMLTPGSWAENMNFWVGFFNPSFFPSLFFRTFIALMIAACYGYLSASFTREEPVRVSMTRFSAKWALVSLGCAVPAGLWYLSVLPGEPYNLVMGKSPTIATVLPWGAAGAVLLLVIMLAAGIKNPERNLKPVALMAIVSALAIMGSFEWTREAARRPFVINEVMYSNSIFKNDVDRLNNEGFLQTALWVENKEISDSNRVQAGEELFIHQCYSCHTVNGRNNDIVKATEKMSYRALSKYIEKIHKVRFFMPPFAGIEDENMALAAYITGGLHGKDTSDFRKPAGFASVAHGAVLFEEHCSSCHAVEDIVSGFEGLERAEIVVMLNSLDEVSEEMEPFSGTPEEGSELAGYLSSLANNTEPAAPAGDDEEGQVQGRLLFEDNCSACHEQGDLSEALLDQDKEKVFTLFATLDEISDEMEPFHGTAQEKEALADFLTGLNKGGE
ncbi:MAG: c-type cytochrome [Desulforhopalus sp.]